MTHRITAIYENAPDSQPIQTLEQLFHFRNRDEVLQFLGRNTFLADLLMRVADVLPIYFADSPAVLEVVSDPESSGDSQLVLFIATSLPPNQAMAALHRFDEEW